jgi:hypothetical protein
MGILSPEVASTSTSGKVADHAVLVARAGVKTAKARGASNDVVRVLRKITRLLEKNRSLAQRHPDW